MKIKTAELTGSPLDWIVTTIEDPDALRYGVEDWKEQRRYGRGEYPHRYHQNWAQGGPIIEREEISLYHEIPAMRDSIWQARPSLSAKGAGGRWGIGPTPLIAAMRCYVASKLGDEVDIPEGLE
jgi:hypothetical protein